MNKPKISVLIGMILMAGLARLIPHPWNVTPVAAMALFGGAYFSDKRLAFLIPFGALLISDLLIGFYSYMPFTYGAFGLVVLVGIWLSSRLTFKNVVIGSLAGSVIFFLVSNLGSFIASGIYPKTGAGLIMCYTAAIPFFRNTLIGDLFYVGILFGAYELAKSRFPVLAKASA